MTLKTENEKRMNLLPASIDNHYRGQKAALWILGLLIFMRTAQGANIIFNGEKTATGADGIPLDAYPPAAADTILSFFALLGLSRLMMALIAAVVLFRYRGMVSFMFAFFLLEFLGRTAILEFLPIPRGDALPAKVLGIVMPVLIVLGLLLSLWRRNPRAAPDEVAS